MLILLTRHDIPVPLALEEQLSVELDRLVENAILTPVDISEWAAPIVVARKPNGKIRICADYSTGLNNALDADDYPIPNIEDILAKLQGNTIFTQLDLSDAYFQLKLDEESKPLTTINTHRELFMFNKLVFGLKPAPAIFQRTLEQALAGIPGVVVYLDDILICGRNREEHDMHLNEILNRLQEWGFRLGIGKCKFHISSVKYLGFVISSKGIEPDPARIKPICSMREPNNTKEVRAILGLVNYYGKFVPNLHRLKAPLELLLKKDAPFVWNSACKKAFLKIKEVLTGPLILAHFDPQQSLIVAADASPTDHRPLLVLFRSSKTKGLDTRTANRLKRWALRLIGYDFDIEYVKSEHFGQADALSRLIQEAKVGSTDPELEEVVASLQEIETELQQLILESSRFLPKTTRDELQ
ncbi:PREDICTED: uncharacterized protein K02A2.6-like [Trachymyrmex cornetzi]|uniref:uncharacterized protein K02A2.6-like n=1 Tax=Trachymyrmex cornetzi TaxID=471704 RepID=UPI00084F5F6C|nr:PREDICTED: uncharacterized protein K02A2.6-like [Trachymyrmex cornetzi]